MIAHNYMHMMDQGNYLYRPTIATVSHNTYNTHTNVTNLITEALHGLVVSIYKTYVLCERSKRL